MPIGRRDQCDSTSYLYNAAGGYAWDYVLTSSGSVGLLLNREKATAMSSELSPDQTEGLIFVQAVAYDVTYKVEIDGTERASYTTPSAADDNNTISTSIVAESLACRSMEVWLFSDGREVLRSRHEGQQHRLRDGGG